MIEDVLAQPHQIGDALWRVEAAGIEPRDLSGGLVICGMGGSAVGGDLAAAAIDSRATRAIRTVRGYELPPDVGPDTLVLCASYSGSTEETLACFDAAGEAGAPRVALTTGGPLAERARAAGVPVAGVPSGMQPRAAVVYMTVGALECAALCGAAPSLRDEIEGAREILEQLAEDSGADSIARALEDTIPVVHGAGPTAAIARRWKTQLNENSKLPAFASELPEANHNEIEGWRRGLDLAPLSAVFIHSPELHPRLERRMELTAERLSDLGAPVVRVDARGDTPVAHVLGLVMAGDLVSVSLAELEDIDPTPVEAIQGFKAALGS
ncbi:MAG: bifunctional phosphoglucose/phosphomannose isomerase [Actinomycetota bacterium]|nr:bifunctional phosphoglucose/phosphomannose isomerase [Actinomycetota bacterium]